MKSRLCGLFEKKGLANLKQYIRLDRIQNKAWFLMSFVNSSFSLAQNTSVWDRVQLSLEEVLGENVSLSWLSNIRYGSIQADSLNLIAKNGLVKSWVEGHYLDTILEVIQKEDPEILKICIEIDTNAPKPKHEAIKASEIVALQPVRKAKVKTQGLHYKHETFDSFIVGDCNRMAYTAARTVADAPGRNHYNPLVLWGKSGQGKTHLLQAIGHYAASHGTAQNVIYTSADDFLKSFMRSVKERKSESFSRFYDSCDVLILDDIQFLAKKERTQDELYKILNRLISHKKQIVLSCDQSPDTVDYLDVRLLSRFQSGLTCAVETMDFATRLEFLHRKASNDGFGLQLDEEAFKWLAVRFQSNARELEGVLVKLLGLRDLMGVELTLDNIRNLVGDIVRTQRKALSIQSIADATAQAFAIKTDLLGAKSRVVTIALPRKVAMHLCRELTDSSLESIGFFFNRDYSTVIASLKAIKQELDDSFELRQKVEEIRLMLTV